MYVIVLGGMARVGKTDAAEFIELMAELNGFFPKRISFAQPLKEAVAAEHGYGKDWQKFKAEKPETYRSECQRIGAACREDNPDHWVDQWKETLYKEMKTELNRDRGKDHWRETLVIVDDCRYENELKAASEFESLSLFISCGTRRLPDIDAEWRTHESERLAMLTEAMEEEKVMLWDWWLFNDGDLDEFEDKLTDRMKYLIGNHPSRWGPMCMCAECQSFRMDVQGAELTDSLDSVLDAIKEAHTDLTEDQTARLERAFDDLKRRLEEGEMKVGEFFAPDWWSDFCKEYGLEDLDGSED